jgi:OOP family OmpA-OmpF porin
MLNKKQMLTAMAFALASTIAAPVSAAESNFYGVFSIGRSILDTDPAAIDAYNLRNGFASSASASSTSSTGGKAQLGYNLGKTFALEGGYTYLGRANFTSITNVGAIGGSKEASLVNIDLVAKLPIPQNEQFSILGRLGVYYWKTRNDMPNVATRGTTTINDNGTDFKIGAGLQYDFTPRFAMRGEFERFNGIGKNETSGDSKVNLLTVGAVLKF